MSPINGSGSVLPGPAGDWDPGLYSKFENERTLAARDLLRRVPLGSARVVVDLGCGPGNSAELLARRFAGATITGLDTSETMLAAARQRVPAARFIKQDIAGWTPEAPPDVIFANAALQFLPDHHTLFPRLIACLAPGGVLAAQMPSTVREFLARFDAHDRCGGSLVIPALADRQVPAGDQRIRGLLPLAAPRRSRIEIWMTTYVHVFDGPDGVADWFAGSALRPYLDLLSDDERWRSSRATATGCARPILFSPTARSCLPIRGCSSSRPGREGSILRPASLGNDQRGLTASAVYPLLTSYNGWN